MTEKTHFGYKQVNKQDKQRLVSGVFSSVAENYDLMNDLMSGGLHRLWKDKFLQELNPIKNTKLIDVAGGTGDIAFRYLKTCPEGKVSIVDINQDMLNIGKTRAIDNGLLTGYEFIYANAEQLNFPDNTFDYYTIAFGIRNVTHIDKALKEALRVLKPGGRFLCLEFTKVDHRILNKLYDFYSFNIIPAIGKLITNNADAYRYLVESIRRFPDKHKFAQMIRNAGFSKVSYKSMTFGVVAIHSGWKIYPS